MVIDADTLYYLLWLTMVIDEHASQFMNIVAGNIHR